VKAEYPFLGFTLYKVFHKKEKRFYVCLVGKNKRMTMSFARYLMSCKLQRKLKKIEEVDHINENKEDDSINNLQILSKPAHRKKSAKGETMVTLMCPECGREFMRPRRNTHIIKGGRPTTCSRKCGYKRMSRILRGFKC
jgi:hypothetical protein